MKRVAKVASPAAIAVLRQATALYPKRKKTIRRIVTESSASERQPEFGPQYWASSRLDPRP
jgi:hypothetical protein